MNLNRFAWLVVATLGVLGLALHSGASAAEPGPSAQASFTTVHVAPKVETDPMPHSGDASDDPAIWINPTDPSKSTIIGTDKTPGAEGTGGGLGVYDLSGHQIQYVSDGGINNVDIRYNFPLAGQPTDLVVGSNKRYSSLTAYRVNPRTRLLESVTAHDPNGIYTGLSAYGICMYHSPFTGKYYVFETQSPHVGDDTGEVQQWELFDNGSGKVDGKKVRTFYVGSDAEGCVADDVTGALYLVPTRQGVYQYGAEPDAGDARTQVASFSTGELKHGLEGVSLYYTSKNTGYLIVSNQGVNTFVVYRRETNAQGQHEYVTTFQIVAGNGIDEVQDTDGIDVTNVNLGSLFPDGVFVAQDGVNDVGNINFKLVPWKSIAGTALTIDTIWNPRSIGGDSGSVPMATPTNTATATATATSTATTAPTAPTELPSPTATSTEEPSVSPTAAKEESASNTVMWLPMLMR
jgi:3-phytase